MCFYPTHPGGVPGGGVGGQKIKSPGNVMNCPEKTPGGSNKSPGNVMNLENPTPTPGGGSRRGGVGVQISKVR